MENAERDLARPARSRIYDGRFYARFIDPFLEGLHAVAAGRIEPGSRVLDIGCGTGALLLRMARVAARADGIELSPAMGRYAAERAASAGADNVAVTVGDALTELARVPPDSYDAATLVLALHEMPSVARREVLARAARAARVVLCLDYAAPQPWNFAGLRNRVAERLAGTEHYAAFLDFRLRGGLDGVAAEAGLTCERLRCLGAGSFELAAIRRPKP